MAWGRWKTTLLEEIEETRKSMVLFGEVNGLTHPETIKLSHQLDELLNELYKSTYKPQLSI